MASRRSKTIEEIDDLMEMFKVVETFGMSWTGLKTLDEMKAKVKEELNPSVDKPSWTAGQVRVLRKCHKVTVIGTLFCRACNSKTVKRHFVSQ